MPDEHANGESVDNEKIVEQENTKGEPNEPTPEEKELARMKTKEGTIKAEARKVLEGQSLDKVPDWVRSEVEKEVSEKNKQSNQYEDLKAEVEELKQFKNEKLLDESIDKIVKTYGWNKNEFSDEYPDFKDTVNKYAEETGSMDKAVKLAKVDLIEAGFKAKKEITTIFSGKETNPTTKFKLVSSKEFDNMSRTARAEYMKKSIEVHKEVVMK